MRSAHVINNPLKKGLSHIWVARSWLYWGLYYSIRRFNCVEALDYYKRIRDLFICILNKWYSSAHRCRRYLHLRRGEQDLPSWPGHPSVSTCWASVSTCWERFEDRFLIHELPIGNLLHSVYHHACIMEGTTHGCQRSQVKCEGFQWISYVYTWDY